MITPTISALAVSASSASSSIEDSALNSPVSTDANIALTGCSFVLFSYIFTSLSKAGN